MNGNERLTANMDLTGSSSQPINVSQDGRKCRGKRCIDVIKEARRRRGLNQDTINNIEEPRGQGEEVGAANISVALVVAFGMYILYKQLL
jgi:hypothetical protein